MMEKGNGLVFGNIGHTLFHLQHLGLPARIFLDRLILLQIPEGTQAQYVLNFQFRGPGGQIGIFVVMDGTEFSGLAVFAV